MSATTPAPVLSDLLDRWVVTAVAEEVWEVLFDDDVLVCAPQARLGDALSARVRVTGPWCGVVAVTCAASTAEELTLRLHRARPLPELAAEDVEDALGEVANVLGGGVKALLPGPSLLGLPEVAPTAPTAPAGPGADTCRVDVLWRGLPLVLTVQGDPAPGSTTTQNDEVPL